MADIKGTHSQDDRTRQVADFPEVRDKIVDSIELSADRNYYGITIRFQDKTTFSFISEPCVVTFPVYSDWTDGEEKPIKRYEAVRSKVPRT